VIVNNASTVEDLTVEQISGIFTGAVTEWGEVQ
jgi:ABC-type phosphate transport system substrate-binding protein